MRRTAEIHRDARDLTLRSLALLRDLDAALRNLRESQPGFPKSSSGAGGGAGSLNDAGKPNGLDRFVVFPDVASKDAAELDELLAVARGAMVKATRIVGVWSAQARPGDDVPTAIVTECVACERVVECTTADPIRAGLCSACHSSWQRWRKAERGHRHDWLTSRRAAAAQAAAQSEAS